MQLANITTRHAILLRNMGGMALAKEESGFKAVGCEHMI